MVIVIKQLIPYCTITKTRTKRVKDIIAVRHTNLFQDPLLYVELVPILITAHFF